MLMQPTPDPDQAMRRFETALRHVLRFSKEDLDAKLKEERAANEGKPKPGPKPKNKT